MNKETYTSGTSMITLPTIEECKIIIAWYTKRYSYAKWYKWQWKMYCKQQIRKYTEILKVLEMNEAMEKLKNA